MQQNSPPAQGYDPERITAELEAISRTIAKYQEIANSEIISLSIHVKRVNQPNVLLKFPVGQIPHEFYMFLGDLITDQKAKAQLVNAAFILIRVNSQVYELSSFIDENTRGDKPAISPDNVAFLKSLQPGQSGFIKTTYGDAVPVQRIS